MGKITVEIPDELERSFREAVFRRYGMKKGNIAKAMEEALAFWVKGIVTTAMAELTLATPEKPTDPEKARYRSMAEFLKKLRSTESFKQIRPLLGLSEEGFDGLIQWCEARSG